MGAITDLHVLDGARVPGAAPGGADPTDVDEIGGVLAAAPPPRARSDRSVVRGSSLVPHGLTVVRAHRTGAPCPRNAPCRKAAEAGRERLGMTCSQVRSSLDHENHGAARKSERLRNACQQVFQEIVAENLPHAMSGHERSYGGAARKVRLWGRSRRNQEKSGRGRSNVSSRGAERTCRRGGRRVRV